ncbi:protein S40-5-like [Solanum dulcamara]|uniref:protein S40-5-like n=1 Tax=Solanum dulcamara TaxID=45834 RepID=UPI002485BA36|nr:protein S40-5-like [Solanum dulcamara]
MAKGRKLATSRSEMLLGNYPSYRNGSATVNGSSELGEDDIWSTVDDMVNGDDHSSRGEWNPHAADESNNVNFGGYVNHKQPPVQQSDHHSRRGRQVGGLSLAFDDSGKTASPRILHQFRGQDAPSPRVAHMATSAPVNVPDWSKIYRVNSVESLHDSDDGVDDHDSEMVPPHEYIARSRNSNAHSVFEGVGRTLKGRDLSRVRDAVWSQTGFDG